MAIVQSSGALQSVHRPAWGLPSPARSVELYGGRRESYAELYRRQPNVRTVVRFLGRNIAQLGLGVYERAGDGDRRRYPRGHELEVLFRRPGPRTTRHRFVRDIVEDLAIFDHAALLKVRHETNGRLYLIRLPAAWCEPVGAGWTDPEAIRVHYNAGPRDYPRDSVVWLHGFDPLDPRAGLSSLEALRRVLAEEANAGEWREQFWRGGARIAGVIERPAEAPEWGTEARDRFREEWGAAYAGSVGEETRTPVLEDGMTWKEATFSPRDAEYLGARKLSREEVAAAYFIPPVFVGILEHANFANIKEQHRSLYQDTLGPWLDWLTTELEAQVLEDEYADTYPLAYLDFNIEEKLRGSFEEQSAAIQSATGAPWMTRNEARSLRNLTPVDGADELVVPLNVLVGGQASPTDSAPPPAPPTGAAALLPAAPVAGSAVKAITDLPRDVLGWRVQHEQVLRRFFTRQRDAALGPLRAGADIAAAIDVDRWNDELRVDLLGLARGMSEELGGAVAERFGGTFDLDRAAAYLDTNARIAAESINGTTVTQLTAARANAGPGFASRTSTPGKVSAVDLEAEEDDDPFGEVFALAITVRAVEASVTRVTGVSSFARHEGAHQAGVRGKVWYVNSGNSRHAALNGETVPLGETFSNGLLWPGDASGSADETAGCVCSLDFTNDL